MIRLVESAACLAPGCHWHAEGEGSHAAARKHLRTTGHGVITSHRPEHQEP